MKRLQSKDINAGCAYFRDSTRCYEGVGLIGSRNKDLVNSNNLIFFRKNRVYIYQKPSEYISSIIRPVVIELIKKKVENVQIVVMTKYS